MKGRVAAAEQRHNEAMSLAWHTEAFARAAEMPSLASVQISPARKREQPPAAPTADAGAMLDAFLTMQALGMPMDIKRIN